MFRFNIKKTSGGTVTYLLPQKPQFRQKQIDKICTSGLNVKLYDVKILRIFHPDVIRCILLNDGVMYKLSLLIEHPLIHRTKSHLSSFTHLFYIALH